MFAGIVYRKQGRRFAQYASVRRQLIGWFVARSVVLHKIKWSAM